MSVMDSKVFESYEDFACEIVQKMQYVEDAIDIVCFYEDARTMIRELILTGACTVGCVDIHDPEWKGYDKEYYITVSKVIDDEWTIWCEPAMREHETDYIYGEADICYLFDNCSSRIIKRIKSSLCYETTIADKDDFECDGDCANYDLNENQDIDSYFNHTKVQHKPKTENIKMDDDMKGFTISTSDDYGYSSFSFHSTDESLVKEMLKNYKKF